MYTPPVPPVAMLSVLPVESGPALAGGVVPPDVARGAWQAAPTSSAAIATDRMRELFISTLLSCWRDASGARAAVRVGPWPVPSAAAPHPFRRPPGRSARI